MLQVDVVQTHVTARCLGDADSVFSFQFPCELVLVQLLVGFGITVERYLFADGGYYRVVHLDGSLVVGIGSQCYAYLAIGA